MNRSLALIITPLLMTLFILSCANKENSAPINQAVPTSKTDRLQSDLEDVYFLVPSPYEVLSIINETHMQYDSKLLNPLGNMERYKTERKQSLNLGIYIVNFAYCSMFSQEYKAQEYLKGIYELTAKNRINTLLPKELYSDIEKDITNVDSLYMKFNDFYFEIISRLEENQKIKLLIYISTGAYIECIHIANGHANAMNNDPAIIIKIAEQKFLFENLYNYAAQALEKEDEVFFILSEIQDCYHELIVELKSPYKISKNKDGTLAIKGGIRLSVNSEYFPVFCSRISKIREKMIN